MSTLIIYYVHTFLYIIYINHGQLQPFFEPAPGPVRHGGSSGSALENFQDVFQGFDLLAMLPTSQPPDPTKVRGGAEIFKRFIDPK